ncbi:MAG: helix-turn-helix transcriptional regulator [Bacteroidales bacterium]
MADYDIFFRFYEKYKNQRFQNINPNDPLVLEVNKIMDNTGQFLHIADYIEIKILYLSKNYQNFFGVDCEKISPAIYFERTHPNDMKRHALGRSKVFQMASELFHSKSDDLFISSHFKTMTHNGNYRDLLYQLCFKFTKLPYPTVYGFQVNTDITDIMAGQKGYHYYVGNDKSMFRYPDEELLKVGNVFSDREFEIIKCIALGMESHEIAEKLYLSVHTINTHRRNVLVKTGKRNTHELVHELQERGVI